MGITNELFMTERDENPSCQYATTPNSITNTEAAHGGGRDELDREVLALHALPRGARAITGHAGRRTVDHGGTGDLRRDGVRVVSYPDAHDEPSRVLALSNQKVNLFSDLLLHDMGTGLADGVSQGEAGPREFRTAPLWGLGQRIFFLHDGRTSDLIATIKAHASSGSEANGVVSNFLGLSETQKQNLLNFLRSL